MVSSYYKLGQVVKLCGSAYWANGLYRINLIRFVYHSAVGTRLSNGEAPSITDEVFTQPLVFSCDYLLFEADCKFDFDLFC